MEQIISKIESLRYDIETGIEDEVIEISVRLIEIRSNIEQLRQYNVVRQREQLNAFVDFYNSRKLSHERINYDEIDVFLESI